MLLKYLWIEDFKNLKDFTIDFEKGNGLTTLIGTNGSGKSNILEAISAIFAGLRNPKNSPAFGYKMEYSINEHNGTGTNIEIKKHPANSTTCLIDGKKKPKKYLIDNGLTPSKIIALYSGEEDRLWKTYYEPFYKKYIDEVIRNKALSGQYMTFINRNYWNIALLVLSTSDNEELRQFVVQQIGIKNIEKISMLVDMDKYSSSSNELVKSFISRLSPDGYGKVENSLDEYKHLFIDQIFDSERHELFDSDGNSLYARSEIADSEHFDRLSQSTVPKYETIKAIEIDFDGGLSVKSLSEGEKKLILIKAVLELVADQNALILLDEPDSHIHESRKKELLDIMRDYTQYGRQIILTSHSPTLANFYNSEGRIMLEKDEHGYVRKIPHEDVKAVELLTGGIWTAVEQNIFFSSFKPLILVEGIGDIKYIEKAIEILAPNNEEYKKLNCDFLQMGGAGENTKQFIDRLSPYVNSNRTVIVLFDRDEEGSKGMEKCVGVGNNRERDVSVYKKRNWYYLMLPKTAEHSYIDFLIEDYFSKDMKNAIAQGLLDNAGGHFNIFPKDLRKKVKDDLSGKIGNYDNIALAGFSTLLDKLVTIIDGSEPVEEIV